MPCASCVDAQFACPVIRVLHSDIGTSWVRLWVYVCVYVCLRVYVCVVCTGVCVCVSVSSVWLCVRVGILSFMSSVHPLWEPDIEKPPSRSLRRERRTWAITSSCSTISGCTLIYRVVVIQSRAPGFILYSPTLEHSPMSGPTSMHSDARSPDEIAICFSFLERSGTLVTCRSNAHSLAGGG